MTTYTRRQLVELLGVEEDFVVELEREEIVFADAPGPSGVYSERMLERTRVAWNLVRELDVNLAGAAVIVRLREEMAALRRGIRALSEELERTRGRGG